MDKIDFKTLKPADFELPEMLYHVSNPKFRTSIRENGLIPNIGDSYLCHAESYTDNANDLIPVIFLKTANDYDSTYDDDRYAIDTQNLDRNFLFKDFDPDMEGCLIYTRPIHKNSFRLIHKGTGNSNI